MAPVHCGLCYAIDSGNYEGAPRRHDPECPNDRPATDAALSHALASRHPQLSTIGELDPLPGQSQVVIADPPTARERAGLFEPHPTLATGRPPNAADVPPFRVDRWTVSIRQITATRVEAEICVWAKLPPVLNTADLEGLVANMPAAAKRLGVGEAKRKIVTGETRLEVMAAIFAFLATEGVVN